MTAFVIDASIVVAALVPEQDSRVARGLMIEAKLAGAHAPAHILLEVANALLMKQRRRLLDQSYRDDALDRFAAYGTIMDAARDRVIVLRRTVELADRHGLSVYDAAYLELADREGMILATFDRRLRQAARAQGVIVALHP